MHPWRKHRRKPSAPWRSTLGLLALVALSLTPVAAAGLDESGQTAVSPPLVNPLTLDIAGKHVAGSACEFSSTVTLSPGEIAVREDVIAVDDASCTARVERGVPADVAEQPVESGMSEESGSAAPDGETATSPADTQAVHSKGYHKSYFEDPPGIDVNSVQNSVDWVWNGNTVSNGHCAYHYGWFSGSGWGLHENNFFCRYENNQTQVRSSSYAHFKNGVFCFFIDTHTYYNRNNAYGKANGYLVGQITWRKSGGCIGLLSFHHILKRTQN